MTKSLLERFINQYGRYPTEVDPDYLEMLRMTKFQISDVPRYKPAKCGNCGSSRADDGRRYLDFQLEIDWYGTFYLCGFCVEEAARRLGLFNAYNETIEALTVKIAELTKLDTEGPELVDQVLKSLDEFREFYGKLLAHQQSDSESDSGGSSDLVSEPTATKSVSDEPKPRITKPAPKSGSKNIPSITELTSPRL